MRRSRRFSLFIFHVYLVHNRPISGLGAETLIGLTHNILIFATSFWFGSFFCFRLASTEDLLVSYPASSIEVKRKNFLHSNAFAKQLDDLMSFEPREAKCISFKAGNKVEEIRDVNDTIFISGWLPALLVTKESHRSFGDLPRITKKIRDNVVRIRRFEYAIIVQWPIVFLFRF